MHYVSEEISPEQFIAEHTLVYIIRGLMHVYDGNKHKILKAGDCCIGRKNRLVRYNKEKVNDELEKVFVFFDEAFLKRFQERYKPQGAKFKSSETIIHIARNKLLPSYIQSLLPHYNHLKIAAPFAEIKREELLLILLEFQPELTALFFDYGIPQKLNIEEFMNRNFMFNVSIDRFAYLTGRSLSAFKRDFKETFGLTPARWLVQKRLQEAYFLIEKKKQKPSDLYLDVGFETLQHFSFAFKGNLARHQQHLRTDQKSATANIAWALWPSEYSQASSIINLTPFIDCPFRSFIVLSCPAISMSLSEVPTFDDDQFSKISNIICGRKNNG